MFTESIVKLQLEIFVFMADRFFSLVYIFLVCIYPFYYLFSHLSFFLVLLRNNWHTSLCKFKAFSMMVWFTYVVNDFHQRFSKHPSSHIDTITRKRRKKFLLVMRTLRIYSFNNLPIHCTGVLAMVTTLYIPSLVLFCLITAGFNFMVTFFQFASPPLSASDNHNSDLFLWLLLILCIISRIIQYLSFSDYFI